MAALETPVMLAPGLWYPPWVRTVFRPGEQFGVLHVYAWDIMVFESEGQFGNITEYKHLHYPTLELLEEKGWTQGKYDVGLYLPPHDNKMYDYARLWFLRD